MGNALDCVLHCKVFAEPGVDLPRKAQAASAPTCLADKAAGRGSDIETQGQ